MPCGDEKKGKGHETKKGSRPAPAPTPPKPMPKGEPVPAGV